jgi:mannose-6-phosphate isomerase-like protein (cupin superfamily)
MASRSRCSGPSGAKSSIATSAVAAFVFFPHGRRGWFYSGAVKTVHLGPNRVTLLARAGDTAGRYSLVLWDMAPPPAPGPPLHRHLNEEEAVYVLGGELDVTVEGRLLRMGPSDFANVPTGVEHTIANPGPERARFLIILSPPGYEGYWEEMGDIAAASGKMPEPDRVLELQAKYNMDSGGVARHFD